MALLALRSLGLVAGLLVTACNGPSEPKFPPGSVRVLFIGNSLTYTNDLPGMLTALARQAGNTALVTHSVAFPNFSIEDHWYEGTAKGLLHSRSWEFVVFQQGPSSLPENQVYLATWVANFDSLVRGAGAEPVLYMVWPSEARAVDFPQVLVSYRNAAHQVGGIFAPAGDGWTAAWETDPAAPLYGPDRFHPSVAGTYVAALVLLGRLAGVDPVTLPATIPGASGYTNQQIRAFQLAARAALQRNTVRP